MIKISDDQILIGVLFCDIGLITLVVLFSINYPHKIYYHLILRIKRISIRSIRL